MAIAIYPADCTDFSTNGDGLLTPTECTVTEEACGMYELVVKQPIDSTNRWAQLVNGAIIKAPVPTRESPLNAVPDPEEPAQPPAEQPQTVTRNVWEVTGTTVGEYMRSGPGMQYKKYGYLKNGARVNEIGRQTVSGRIWIHCIVQKGGRNCWMSTKWLKLVGTIDEMVGGGKVKPSTPAAKPSVMPLQAQDQLFRIYSVERNTKEQIVTAKAMHIFYDLRGNLVKGNEYFTKLPETTKPANKVMTNIWNNLVTPVTDFSLHFDGNITARVTGDYAWKNPIECMLDPDQGVLPQAKAILVRDNYDIYVIPDTVHDSQVTIRRYKNLKGVTVTEDSSDIVTRIIPCGKNKEGDDIFINADGNGTTWIDSKYIDLYPIPYIKKIDYDVKVVDKDPDNESTFPSGATARAKLKELAQADFDENGVDLPTYSMKVDFVLLQNTEDYADYADLQAVFLNDTVTVIDSLIGLTARVRVSGYDWDAIRCQYNSVTLGDLDSLEQTVYSYNLPSGGISGSKIAPGTLGGNALRSLSVDYAKISVAAIEQLIAESLSAVEANIENLIAGHITAESITTGLIEAVTGIIENLKAGSIDADELTARFAEFATVVAGTAEFDRETVQHLVAEAMHLSFGEADSVFIQNLMVTYAQFAAATIGDLIIKASDGKYYSLDVDPATGLVTATQNADVTEGDIESGHKDGQTIIDTNIVAENLSTSNLFATYALINQIDAARIDVDQLFAREAFLGLLWTTQIHGDESIEFWAHSSVRSVKTEYCISDSPSIPTGEWSETFPGAVASDQYIWKRLKAYKGSGEYEYTSEECITLASGAQGPAGVGIESVEEYYGLSASADVQPAEWSTTPMPPTPDQRWLWNKEVIHYDNQTTQDGEPHIIGVFGQDGKIGRGINEVKNWYLASAESSGVTRETKGWSLEMQTTTTELRYLWNYEEIVWNDGSEASYTNPIIIGTHGATGDPGPQGPAGDQGIEGPKGDDGKSCYFHIKYAAKLGENGIPAVEDMSEEAAAFIGTYTDDQPADSNDPFAYKWQRLEGAQGPEGKQGIPGVGQDGKTSYLHIKYSDDGGTSFTANEGEDPGDWIGQYVDFTQDDSTDPTHYKWAKIKGEQGQPGLQGLQGDQGEQGIEGPPGPAGTSSYFHIRYSMVESPQSSDEMNEEGGTYIGTYVDSEPTDSNDPLQYTWRRFQGAQGPEGEQGIPGDNGTNGETSYLHIKYSNDGGATLTDDDGETPGDYIGFYVDFTADDSMDVSMYKWSKTKGERGEQGNQGDKGADGRGVLSAVVEYGVTDGGNSQPTTWQTSIPNTTPGQVLWTRTTITYTDKTTSTVYTVSRNGSNGAAGSAGKGIKTVTNYYLAYTSSSGVTTSTPGWTETVQMITSANRFLWNYEVTEYTDSTSAATTPHVIGAYGFTGSAGKGIKAIDEYYALSSTTTAPADTSFSTTVPTMTSTNRYLWNYEKISYTDNTSTNSTKHIIGVYGQTGAAGTAGAYCTPHEQYYLSSSDTTLTGGAWTETQPTWAEGKYLWERLRLVWSDGRADTYTNASRARALEQAIQDAQNAEKLADAANQTAANAAGDLNKLNGDMNTLQKQLSHLDTRMTLVGDTSAGADEAPSTQRPAGLYVGLDGWPVQAYIDATGWFRVWANGESITAMGPNEIDLGELTFYNNNKDVAVMKKG